MHMHATVCICSRHDCNHTLWNLSCHLGRLTLLLSLNKPNYACLKNSINRLYLNVTIRHTHVCTNVSAHTSQIHTLKRYVTHQRTCTRSIENTNILMDLNLYIYRRDNTQNCGLGRVAETCIRAGCHGTWYAHMYLYVLCTFLGEWICYESKYI